MGEIRFVGTGETRGYSYLVCKKRFVGTGETRGYSYLVCKKRFVGTGETRGYSYLVCKKRFVGTGETRGYSYLVCKNYRVLILVPSQPFSTSFIVVRDDSLISKDTSLRTEEPG